MNKVKKFVKPYKTVVAVIGLGYVGLPLLIELSKKYEVVGFDINKSRVKNLQEGLDTNNEISGEDLKNSSAIFTNSKQDIHRCNFLIVTVPTPIDEKNKPDLTLLRNAMEMIACQIKRNDIIVLESTVYPGVTEQICGPILEQGSGLICNEDFFIGYSPERVNPGDKVNTINKITKVVSAQNRDVLDYMAEIYGSVNNNNIFKAKNIKTAEAAKVVENTQRDLNIAFINEISKILNQEGISVHDVLDAAQTKWNFLNFKPGLVGGHCIGVDPYYLSFYSELLGVNSHLIEAGRATNDNMSAYISDFIVDNLKRSNVRGKRILLLGFTFKENVNDTRNTKIYGLYKALKQADFDVDIHDPLVDEKQFLEYPDLSLQDVSSGSKYDLVALCVPHHVFIEKRDFYLSSCLHDYGMVFDLKGVWKHEAAKLGYGYFTL